MLARRRTVRHLAVMFNVISIVVALIALPVALVGLIPFLGIANYAAIPIAVAGLAIGLLSSHRSGRNLNILVLVVAVVRLWLGGFIL